MKRRLLYFFLLLCCSLSNSYASKRITIKGVQYEQSVDNTATATLTVQAKGQVVVQESVKMGKHLYLVVQVNEAAFSKNQNITAVTLPKSIKTIKKGAFNGCSWLSKLSLPSGWYVIEKDAFIGCASIAELEGNLTPYLEYRQKEGGEFIAGSIKKAKTPLFSTYAEPKLKARMQMWQTKKGYETMEQYKARVTDENRKKRMDEYVTELQQEFASIYAPSTVSTGLGYYDSEYGIFTIHTLFYGDVYAQVPKAEANNFKLNFNNVEVIPQFGVKGDTLAIASCKFKLGEKVYSNAVAYAGAGNNNYNFELPPLDINLAAVGGGTSAGAPATVAGVVDNAVDKNIPKGKLKNDKTFALIIGNEQYKRVSAVPFANNDAKIFAEYCKKTLGVPANNVKLHLNVGLNDMRHAVTALINTLKAYEGEAKAIVYYAGHGVPDESNRMPYLLPVDGFATDIKSGYNLSDLYDELAEAPSQMTMVLLDACFSGTKREGDMLADARGVAIKVKNPMPTGNLFVFSASQGSETAYSDRTHGHGMFTYFLLKHLQETEGNTTMSKLTDYVITNVKRSSVTSNDGKIQTPTIIPSPSLMNTWQDLNFK